MIILKISSNIHLNSENHVFLRDSNDHYYYNLLGLNEKSNKWICPVCNKLALFEDLQIDAYTDGILNSIKNENITEITVNSELLWTPVIQSKAANDFDNYQLNNQNSVKTLSSSSTEVIFIDDD